MARTNSRFKKLEAKVLATINKYSAKIIGLLIAGVAISIIASLIPVGYNKPIVAGEFAETSVMIWGKNMRSGGSGVILRSNVMGSTILTNKHICRLIEGGGYVEKNGKMSIVESYKKYPVHDLCLVKVFKNFGVNTKVADSKPTDFEPAFISGHPALLPHVLTKGNFSGHQIINLVVGLKKCTKNTPKKYLMYCLFFGAIPYVQNFDAQLVTGTILPGSSGSGVFNSDGEISGVVFAGRGRGLGYAFIVPHQYVVHFIETENDYDWTSVRTTNYDHMIRRIFGLQKTCNTNTNPRLDSFCKNHQGHLIWEK